jgi:hypothetical protein
MENSGRADTKQVKSGAKRRPPAAGKGRQKGSVNKATRELKEMILEALGNAGGVEYLERKANDPRTASAFLSLIGKVLPMTIQGPNKDGSHTFTVNQPWLQQSIQDRN